MASMFVSAEILNRHFEINTTPNAPRLKVCGAFYVKKPLERFNFRESTKMSINEKAVQVLCGKLRFNSRGEFESRVVEITPVIAADLLGLSVGNRSKKDKHISFLANQITAGKFVITNNAISFDKDFILRDGHHRLCAVLAANKSIMACVAIGIAAENFKFVDIGINRSQSDMLGMYSDLDRRLTSPRAVSIAKNMILSRAADVVSSKNTDLVEAVLLSNKAGIIFALENISSGQRFTSVIAVSAAVASAFNHVDKQKLSLFCAMLCLGNPARVNGESEAGLYLRDALSTGKIANAIAKNRIGSGSGTMRVIFRATQIAIKEAMNGTNYAKAKIGAKFNEETKSIDYHPIIYPPIIPFVK
jgi:hypothetical protein